ncbi:unnamed protein product, partial [Rotaria sp. Silwood1]
SIDHHRTYSSEQIRKRARLFLEYESEEDYRLHEQLSNFSELVPANTSNSDTVNIAEINNDNTLQEPNMNSHETTETIIENNSLFARDNDIELISTMTNLSSNITNNSSTTHIQNKSCFICNYI